MQAAVFAGVGRLDLREVDQPVIHRPDEVRLRVEAVGICGTDVHITSNPPGYAATAGIILGHEFVGRVEDVGDAVAHIEPGDRVVVNPNLSCGVCQACASLRPNLCSRIRAIGIHENGAFAEQWVGAAQLCHRISEAVSPLAGAFAEMLADVVNGTRRSNVRPGMSVVVLGLGPIGHLFAQVLRQSGADPIILIDRAPYRLEIARRLGWSNVLDGSDPGIAERVRDLVPAGPDIVVDASGGALGSAVEFAARGGTILVFGVNTRATVELPQALVTTKELRILGTWLAPGTFPEAVAILESGKLELEPLVTHRFPLPGIFEALDLLRAQRALKIVIQP